MITVIGIFDDKALAEQAADYLIANDFNNENVDVHTDDEEVSQSDRIVDFFNHVYDNGNDAAHYASLSRKGTVVTVHAASAREAQEAVDAFNNHGAISVDANDTRSLLIEKIVIPEYRLRG